ncbi:TetR/AcrR family transcriptional regulator [Nocardia nova]|uniref:TetR/AcrR family transcriptional regulator n=1 Tax=Nocardia nova TaxID=37330 RepID=UPI0034115EDB
MREQLLDAAIRAIDMNGPAVTMREIAAEASIPKPTLYRFFIDKQEMMVALGERVRETILGRISSMPLTPEATLSDIVHFALAGYADILIEHPNVFRFLDITPTPIGTMDEALKNPRAVAAAVAGLLEVALRALGGVPQNAMINAAMIVGAVTTAGNWWLGQSDPSDGAQEFVSRVEKSVLMMVSVAAEESGVIIDFDEPVYLRLGGLISGSDNTKP